jgi:putative oxidoreductase
MDIGLLIIRLVVGGLFIGHGTQKLFGWWGGHGLNGTGQFMESLGYPSGRNMATVAGLAEAGGGTLLVLGFATPLGAAAIIGTMINASLTAHRGKGLWNINGGFELPLVMASVAAGLAFVGAGQYSIDAAIGWKMSGSDAGVGAIALGAGAATVAMMTRRPARRAAEERRRHAA